MKTCSWCGCQVDERKLDLDGNHTCFTDCIQALKVKVINLTQELVDERTITAELTERLEICEYCPTADPVTAYEEQKRAVERKK